MAEYTDNYNLILPGKLEKYDVEVANANNISIDNILKGKVDGEAGKGLSECNFTLEYKRKIDNINPGKIEDLEHDNAENKSNISSNTKAIQTLQTNIEEKANKSQLQLYSLITETGSQIELNINSSDFKLKAILKDKNGNTIFTSNIIDLPLETMVVGASYDNTTKEVVLTLQNGTTVRFSVADLVSGLVSTDQLTQILSNYYNKTETNNLLANHYTKSETDTLLNEKADKSEIPDLTNYATITYVDNIVGDIESILEELDIGGGVE